MTRKTDLTKPGSIASIITFLMLALGALVAGLLARDTTGRSITGYDECTRAAGSTIQESFPARCTTADGVTFTQPQP
jgi:hypothetical protein